MAVVESKLRGKTYRVLGKIKYQRQTHEQLREQARAAGLPVEQFLWYKILETSDVRKAQAAAKKAVDDGEATQARIIKIQEISRYKPGKVK